MVKESIIQTVENNSMYVALEALVKSIARWAEKIEQHTTAVPGLSLFRREEPTEPVTGMYEPSVSDRLRRRGVIRSGWLRKPFPVQSRIQSRIWFTTLTGHHKLAATGCLRRKPAV